MRSKSLTYSFVTNLIFLIAINLVIKPIWVFVIDRNVQLHFGFNAYGIFYALLNITYLFNALLDLGLTNYHQREVAQNNLSFTRLFGNIFSLKWLLALVYIFVCIVFAVLWKYDLEKIKWLCWLAASQVLVSFILFLRTTFSAMQHYFLDSLISIMDKVLMIIVIGYLLFFDAANFTMQQFIIAQFAAYFLTFLFALILVFRFKKSVEKPAFAELKNIIVQARPFTMLLLWMTIYFRLDSVLVERLSKNNPALESGIYAAAYRLLDMVNMFAYLFSMLLFPMFNRLIAEKKSLNNLIQLSSPLLLSVAWIVSCSVLFFHEQWFALLYHQHDLYSSQVLMLVLFSFMGVSLQYIFSTAVTASGKLHLQNRAAFVAVVFNALCNFIFIPKYGAMAASAIAFITLTSMGLYNYWMAKKIFQLQLYPRKMLLWSLWALLSLGCYFIAAQFLFSFLMQQIVLCIFCLLLGWAIKVLPVKHFVNAVQEK